MYRYIVFIFIHTSLCTLFVLYINCNVCMRTWSRACAHSFTYIFYNYYADWCDVVTIATAFALSRLCLCRSHSLSLSPYVSRWRWRGVGVFICCIHLCGHLRNTNHVCCFCVYICFACIRFYLNLLLCDVRMHRMYIVIHARRLQYLNVISGFWRHGVGVCRTHPRASALTHRTVECVVSPQKCVYT